jgi:4-hydroxybenzoate polyprenyltransferase
MYFTNDYFDVELDLKSPIKNHTNVRLIKKNKSVFGFSIFVIFLLLLAFAYSIGMKIFLATSVALLTNLLYSLKFKRMLALDLVALFIWSASIVYLAVPGFDVYGLKLAILMGIMTMASHVIQCMRDYKFDKLYNVDTTVVRIGREKSKKLLKLILMVIPLYSIFVLNNPFGVVLLISLFFNFDQKIEKYWLKIKILFMILWVFLILSTFTGI